MTDTLKFELEEEVLINENCANKDLHGRKAKIIEISSGNIVPFLTRDGVFDTWHKKSCLTKLQDKPMQDTKAEILKIVKEIRALPVLDERTPDQIINGEDMQNTQDIKPKDQVRIVKNDDPRKDKTGMVTEIIEKIGVVTNTPYKHYSVRFPDGLRATYCKEHLEKITQESEQVKLEVGQKYDLDAIEHNPHRFIVFDENEYCFRNSAGEIVAFDEKQIKGIKKHSEPFKHKLVKYFLYDEEESPQPDTLTDQLTKKYTSLSNYFYDSYAKALQEVSNINDGSLKIGKIEIDATVHYDVTE